MRLIKEYIERDGSGSVTLYPEDPEDMWAAYNIIRPGDLLRAAAVRRVTHESAGTGATQSSRITTTLSIRVKDTTFDASAAQLHVAGRIAAETPHAKLGQHHTLDLALHRNFTLGKEGAPDGWDSVNRGVIREACKAGRGASAWVVLMHEGLAHVVELVGRRSVLRRRVSVRIPGKRGGSKERDRAMQRFFDLTQTALLHFLDLPNNPDSSIPILLASPAFTAAAFQTHLLAAATRTGNKALLAQKPNLIVGHAATGNLHSLAQALAQPAVAARLAGTADARDAALLDKLEAALRRDDGRAWYGPREVARAVEAGAVGRGGGALLVSDARFRAADPAERRRWVELVDRVKNVEGGEARVVSSELESGRRLEALGGVAALLTFPLHDSDESEGEDEDGGVGVEDGVERGDGAEFAFTGKEAKEQKPVKA